ncbi:MAG: ABC transporter permease [Caldilineaceae bacterium]|nr:ABC transporter permease [Caldilineaceae bacterium]
MTTAQVNSTVLSLDKSAKRPQNSWWQDVWRRFAQQKAPLVAGVLFLILLVLALLAPVIAPYDPVQQFRKEGLSALGQPLAPNAQFWLGTDGLGRDLLSRLLYGARVSLGIGLAASAIAVLIGLLVGGIAGFAGGKVDFFLMRLVDLIMSMPTFFIILLLVVMLRPGVWVVITVISLFSWTAPARVFRSQILAVKERDFVLAAHSLGVRRRRIFIRHLLPHVIPLVIVYLALNVPNTIFAEASLSFLGLGVPQPIPSWGSMIQDGFAYYRAAPWIALFPGLSIALAVVSINLLGTGLREAMDPMRKR